MYSIVIDRKFHFPPGDPPQNEDSPRIVNSSGQKARNTHRPKSVTQTVLRSSGFKVARWNIISSHNIGLSRRFIFENKKLLYFHVYKCRKIFTQTSPAGIIWVADNNLGNRLQHFGKLRQKNRFLHLSRTCFSVIL